MADSITMTGLMLTAWQVNGLRGKTPTGNTVAGLGR